MARYKAILIGLAAAAMTACTAPPPPPTPTATVTVTVEPSPSPSPDIDGATAAVGRIVTELCEGGRSGSGFLIAPDLVLTADHVVADGASATITFPDDQSPIALSPVRLEPSLDIALLRLERPVSARPFELADHPAKRLQPVTVIGYPLGMTAVHTNSGTVSSTEDDVPYSANVTIEDVLTLDAAVNPGNSGGPVIDSQLAVLGLISSSALNNDGDATEGLHFAIPVTHLRTLVDGWSDEESGRFDGCGGDDANVDEPELLVRTDHALGTTFGELLAAHGRAINESDYSTAWDQFTVAMKGRQGSLEEWSAGLASTRWIVVEIRGVVQTGGSAEVRTFVRTHQDTSSGPNGQVCSIWPLTYDLKVENGEWHIDRVKQRARQPAKCTR